MNTEIKERIYITDPTQEIVDWCENNLVVRNPTYDTLKRMGKEDTIRYRHVPESLKLYSNSPFGDIPIIAYIVFSNPSERIGVAVKPYLYLAGILSTTF